MEKKIIVKITPAAVLLVVLLLVGAFLLHRGVRQEKRPLTIDDTPVIVTKIRSLGELTTACYYDEMVLSRTKENAFSSSALGSLAEGLGKDVDDHLVLIAKGTVRAGLDLMDMSEEDVRFVGDTAYIRLPAPQYLDVIVNPSDFEVFAETGKWTHEEITGLQETARTRLLMGADHYGLKSRAYAGAMDAVTELLVASGYTYIRFDHPGSYIRMPMPRE
jgi:hypothetical protein